jgi:hypothetical protein
MKQPPTAEESKFRSMEKVIFINTEMSKVIFKIFGSRSVMKEGSTEKL